jgi:NitT/TauT family transport system substrate-binding protein
MGRTAMHRIRLSENFRAVFYAPFYATRALGHFAREGVDVELINSPAPAAATAGLLDGSIDVSWGGPMRVMKARDDVNGAPMMTFCEVVRRDPFYLVARKDLDAFSLADLPRLRFGSVSEVPTPWLCLQHDLREIGIDPASLARVADRSMADNVAALADGTLDVAQMFEPFAARAEREVIGRVVYAASSRGETSYTTFLATRDSIARNREAFAAMTRAVALTQAWIGRTDAEGIVEAVRAFYPDVPQADLLAAFARYRTAALWATDTNVSRVGFERLALSLQSGGFIAKLPAYEDCVVNFG